MAILVLKIWVAMGGLKVARHWQAQNIGDNVMISIRRKYGLEFVGNQLHIFFILMLNFVELLFKFSLKPWKVQEHCFFEFDLRTLSKPLVDRVWKVVFHNQLHWITRDITSEYGPCWPLLVIIAIDVGDPAFLCIFASSSRASPHGSYRSQLDV